MRDMVRRKAGSQGGFRPLYSLLPGRIWGMFFRSAPAMAIGITRQMKKSNPSKRKTATRKSPRPSDVPSRRKAANPAGPEPDAINVSSGARALQGKTGQLHQTADDLHKPIQKMHVKVSSQRSQA